jgi:hypothetical protein
MPGCSWQITTLAKHYANQVTKQVSITGRPNCEISHGFLSGHVDAAASIYMKSRKLEMLRANNVQPQSGTSNDSNVVAEDFIDLHR